MQCCDAALSLSRLGIALPKPPSSHGLFLAQSQPGAAEFDMPHPLGSVPRSPQAFAMWLSGIATATETPLLRPAHDGVDEASPQIRLVRSVLATCSATEWFHAGNINAAMYGTPNGTPVPTVAPLGPGCMAIDPGLAAKCLSLGAAYSDAIVGARDISAAVVMEAIAERSGVDDADSGAAEHRSKPSVSGRYSIFGKSKSIPERQRGVAIKSVPAKHSSRRSATVSYPEMNAADGGAGGMRNPKSASLAGRSTLGPVDEVHGPAVVVVGTGETDGVLDAVQSWSSQLHIVQVCVASCAPTRPSSCVIVGVVLDASLRAPTTVSRSCCACSFRSLRRRGR
jgi:hypothetical protein